MGKDTFLFPQTLKAFNELFDKPLHSFVEQAKFPFYDIIKLDENNFQIKMAVAGYGKSDLKITLDKNILKVEGTGDKTDDKTEYLYQSLAMRNFMRCFGLGEHVLVNETNLENGILTISLKREIPEAAKPKEIAING